jgi:hypothetical protein
MNNYWTDKVFPITQNDQLMEPIAASLAKTDAIFARTWIGTMIEMIRLSFVDRNGFINIHPDATRTEVKVSNISHS